MALSPASHASFPSCALTSLPSAAPSACQTRSEARLQLPSKESGFFASSALASVASSFATPAPSRRTHSSSQRCGRVWAWAALAAQTEATSIAARIDPSGVERSYHLTLGSGNRVVDVDVGVADDVNVNEVSG